MTTPTGGLAKLHKLFENGLNTVSRKFLSDTKGIEEALSVISSYKNTKTHLSRQAKEAHMKAVIVLICAYALLLLGIVFCPINPLMGLAYFAIHSGAFYYGINRFIMARNLKKMLQNFCTYYKLDLQAKSISFERDRFMGVLKEDTCLPRCCVLKINVPSYKASDLAALWSGKASTSS